MVKYECIVDRLPWTGMVICVWMTKKKDRQSRLRGRSRDGDKAWLSPVSVLNWITRLSVATRWSQPTSRTNPSSACPSNHPSIQPSVYPPFKAIKGWSRPKDAGPPEAGGNSRKSPTTWLGWWLLLGACHCSWCLHPSMLMLTFLLPRSSCWVMYRFRSAGIFSGNDLVSLYTCGFQLKICKAM